MAQRFMYSLNRGAHWNTVFIDLSFVEMRTKTIKMCVKFYWARNTFCRKVDFFVKWQVFA